MTLAEYLKSQGLTDEEVKVMDTPVMRKLHDEREAATTLAASETKKRNEYEGKVQVWYDANVAKMDKKDKEVITARAEAAKLKGAFKAAKDTGMDGLAELAKEMGIDVDDPAPAARAAAAAAAPPDASQFYTKSEVDKAAMDARGYAEMTADITNEHRRLFGETPSFRQLRTEANAAGLGLEAFWQQKYKIAEKRQEVANNEVRAREDKIREEEREKVRSEYTARGVNPDLANPGVSNNPLRPLTREGVRGEGKQPWEYGDQSGERVKRALNAWTKSPAAHSAVQ